MSTLTNRLLDRYALKDSIKEYKGYKVKSPEITINNIESAFEKINLKIAYQPNNYNILRKYYPFQTGTAALYPQENNAIVLLNTFGKGVSSILSRASATAELIERFAGYGIAKPFITHYLPSIKQKQIWEKRRGLNQRIEKNFSFHSIDTIDEIPAEKKEQYNQMAKSICYSLTRNKIFSFPEEFYINFVGSNGLASGNTYEEATLHGIFEVLERLGAMYVLDVQPDCNKIAEDSFTHPTLKKLMEVVHLTGVDFEILDFSFIFNIPLIVTIFDNPLWNPLKDVYTISTNLQYPKMVVGVDTDPQDATMRCFTEFIQGSLPMLLAKHNEQEFRSQFKLSKLTIPEEIDLLFQTSLIRSLSNGQPFSIDYRKYAQKPRNEIPITNIDSLYDKNQKTEIVRIINKLKEKNIEVLVQDIAHPIIQFPVVLVMLSGGEDYFSNISLTYYPWLILGNNEKRKYILKKKVEEILSPNPLHKIIKGEKWCHDVDNLDLISHVIQELCWGASPELLWGVNINKYYFLGMLYLRMNKYERSQHCFEAAVCGKFDDIPSLSGLAYIFSKTGKKEEYEDIVMHIKTIARYSIDINKKFEDMRNPIVSPNPFEPCDLKCKNKNKPHLCETCFFNYVSEDVFMNKITDSLL